MPIDKQINKMWFTHLLGLYAIIKSNEELTHTTTWVNHEFKMLAHLRGIYQAERCEKAITRDETNQSCLAWGAGGRAPLLQ